MKKKTKKSKAKKSSTRRASAPVPKNTIGAIPLQDRVLVKPTLPEETTSFGLIIPDTTKEKPETGTVVAVGPGKVGSDNKLIPVSVEVGDKIMFDKYGYTEIKIRGIQYYIVGEQNILAILN